MISVTVAVTEGENITLVCLDCADEATVADALAMVQRQQGRDLGNRPLGIFGERCELSRRLAEGDRLEIYSPLKQDAKAARRARAKIQGASQRKPKSSR